MKFALGLALLAAFLTGSAAAKETAAFSDLPAKEGYVRLYLYRPKQFVGSGIKPVVKIDGIEVGRLANGRRLALYIRPGPHSLETKLSPLNYPIKGGLAQLEVPASGELYLLYATELSSSERPGYIVYRNGFIQPDEEFSKTTIKQSTPLALDPDVLLKRPEGAG